MGLDLALLAGEASGDLHGASLIEQLLVQNPRLRIGAVAGPRMREQKVEVLSAMEKLQVMGFTDVAVALPRLMGQFFQIRDRILTLQPRAVVTIDYPGFHLRLAKSLRKKGYAGKLIHYICPTVWAWGKGRIPLMAGVFDLLLTLFPFEPACFEGTPLAVHYVGHPLASAIPRASPGAREPWLALFPGSRTHEIERNFPLQLAAAKMLQKRGARLRIAVSIAHPRLEARIRQLGNMGTDAEIEYVAPDQTYSLMAKARLALATSGTVALELALHETPAVVNYFIRPFDLFLAQKIFRIHLPFYCIANIVAGYAVYPELFGPRLTPENLAAAAQTLWFDEEARAKSQEDCRAVRRCLGTRPGPHEAALAILECMGK